MNLHGISVTVGGFLKSIPSIEIIDLALKKNNNSIDATGVEKPPTFLL